MDPRLSSFIAGLLVGIAVTAGIAAVVVRLSDLEQRAQNSGQSAAAQDGPDQVRQLRLAHSLNTKHPVHAGLVRFAELAEQYSDGRLTIQIFPNAELGSETETLEALQVGTLDLAKSSTAPLESFAPAYGTFSVPYAFRDSAHFWDVLNSEIGRELLVAAVDRGLRGLCYYDSGARSFYTADAPILKPEDVQGLKVRVMKSPTAISMIQAFGGSPTPMAYGELYSALQSRLVDAAENNPPSFYTSRHYEVCKHYSLNEHARIPDVLLISEQTWRELSTQAREWLQRAADDSVPYQRELWERLTVESLEAVEAEGVTIYRPDFKPFATAMSDLHASYEGTPVGDLLARIKAVSGSGAQ